MIEDDIDKYVEKSQEFYANYLDLFEKKDWATLAEKFVEKKICLVMERCLLNLPLFSTIRILRTERPSLICFFPDNTDKNDVPALYGYIEIYRISGNILTLEYKAYRVAKWNSDVKCWLISTEKQNIFMWCQTKLL